MTVKKKIRLIIPSEVSERDKKKIIGEMLLNQFLENPRSEWIEFKWGRRRFRITRI